MSLVRPSLRFFISLLMATLLCLNKSGLLINAPSWNTVLNSEVSRMNAFHLDAYRKWWDYKLWFSHLPNTLSNMEINNIKIKSLLHYTPMWREFIMSNGYFHSDPFSSRLTYNFQILSGVATLYERICIKFVQELPNAISILSYLPYGRRKVKRWMKRVDGIII